MVRVRATVVADRLSDLAQAVEREKTRLCQLGAETAVASMRQSIGGNGGTGLVLNAVPNELSAPGEPPVDQGGPLLQSIHVAEPSELDGADAAAAVVDASYAGYLEFGTSKMAPRPFVAPAAELAEEAIREELGRSAVEIWSV